MRLNLLFFFCLSLLSYLPNAWSYVNSSYRFPDPQGWHLHTNYQFSDFMMVKTQSEVKPSMIFTMSIPLSETLNSFKENLILETTKHGVILKTEETKNPLGFSYLLIQYRRTLKNEIETVAVFHQNQNAVLIYHSADTSLAQDEMPIFNQIINQFSFVQKKHSVLNYFVLPTAEAANPNTCIINPTDHNISSIQNVNSVIDRQILSTMMSCAHKVVDGVWDSTGGRAQAAAECFKSPIQCAHSTVDSLRNIYAMMSDLKNSILKVGQYLSNADLTSLACSMAGSLGTDIVIVAATSGLGGAKLAATMGQLTGKMASLLNILAKTGRLKVPIEMLAKYKNETLEKISQIMQRGKLSTQQLESQLLMCSK